ncbi:MAG: OmpA family protein [Siculibacillus sp.]|nr:OmpA family protein [Siculibacillus sp.]
MNEVHQHRETFVDGGVRYVREPGRVIIREEGGPAYIRHDESERFSILGYRPQVVHEGGFIRSYYDRPDGVRIITVTDQDGRLVRRIRRYPDGREVVIIDNDFRPRPTRFIDQVVILPPPVLTIPQESYIVDAGVADEATIYEALTAPPLTRVSRRYTLDEVRYSPDLRAQMRSVDVNSITFDSGSWIVEGGQIDRLATIAAAIGKAVQANPEEVFLVEGHTDAIGDQDDNLSLSDRRAQSVAEILSRDFAIPAENLTTQGYGEAQLRVATDGAARANRRVTIRRITPLIAGSADQPQ